MKKTVDENEFIRAFDEYGRGNNFSVAGRKALFDFFTRYEEDSGEEIELDVIAICCDYTEFENLAEYNEAYGKEYESLDDVREHTDVINVDNERFIILNY